MIYSYNGILCSNKTNSPLIDIEMHKFQIDNKNFVDSKINSYLYMGKYHAGLVAFTSTITVVMIFFGALFISNGAITTADLIAFAL